jgi:hypothetical protein
VGEYKIQEIAAEKYELQQKTTGQELKTHQTKLGVPNKPADGKAETKQITTQWMLRATAQFTVLGLALKEKIIRW